MKKLISFLLALTMILSFSIAAYATDDVGVVEYRQKHFFFGPGSLYSDTDLFTDLTKGVMPGDEVHQQVKIYHNGSQNVNIRVFIKAEGSDLNADFIEKMNLQVEHKNGDILYDGDDYDATAANEEWTQLATLAPGKATTLDLTLTVPIDMSDEFADHIGTVVWKFKVEEIPIDPNSPNEEGTIDPNSPQTGDNRNFTGWAAVLFISGASLAALLFTRKRRNG